MAYKDNYRPPRKCFSCDGSGSVECRACYGTGYGNNDKKCRVCSGLFDIYMGSGKRECKKCKGRGYI